MIQRAADRSGRDGTVSVHDAAEVAPGVRAALHELRDHLTADRVLHVGARLPFHIRGAYFEGWYSPAAHVDVRSLQRVRDPDDLEEVWRLLKGAREGQGADAR